VDDVRTYLPPTARYGVSRRMMMQVSGRADVWVPRRTYGLIVQPLACVAAGTLGGVLIDGQPKTGVSDPPDQDRPSCE
jgi:hypothetical protein